MSDAADPTLDVTTFLRQVPLFAALPEDELAALAALAELVRVGAGETVFRQGDAGDRMFVVVHGQVLIEREAPGEAPVTLVTLGSKQFFGEMALFDDVRRSATARSYGKSSLLVSVSRDVFTGLLRRDIGIALHVIRGQSQRLRELNERFVDVDREAKRHAPALEEIVEEEYPHPIAIVHQEMVFAADAGTKLRRALELTEVVLLYTASLARAAYVAHGVPDSEIDAELAAGQRASTLGSLHRILRLATGYLVTGQGVGGVVRALHAWHQQKKGGSKVVVQLLDEVTTLRNELKHGSEAALDEAAAARLLDGIQPKVTRLVESLDFLRGYPLACVQGMTFCDGAFQYSLQMCRGAFRSFRTETFGHPEPLETHKLYLLDREGGRPLALYPWMGLYRCDTCGDRDIFLTQKWSSRRVDGIEFGRGHRYVVKEPGALVGKLADELFQRTRAATGQDPGTSTPRG